MQARSIGEHLRGWRQRRRLSQLDLALDADISARHLSFVETGRARPSRDLVLHLAEQLEVPLRERNRLLLAAGFAPAYPDRPLGHPSLDAVRSAVERLLVAHEPNPALALDQSWTLLDANAAVAPLLDGVAPRLLVPPVNVLRLSLHPDGLAPRIVNLAQWRSHLLHRLRRQIEATADDALTDLLAELRSYPSPSPIAANDDTGEPDIVIPFRLALGDTVLGFISTTTVFGTAQEIAVADVMLETFFPADAATRRFLGDQPMRKPVPTT